MVLQIEGYNAVVPNVVYTSGLDRSEFPQLVEGDNPIGILVVDRYKQPADKSQVIEYLKERSLEASTTPQLTDADGNPISSGQNTTPLTTMLSKLPQNVLADLRADQTDLLQPLNKSIPLKDGGSEYVRLGYGVLPSGFIEDNSHVTANGRKGYLALLNYGGMKKAGFGLEWGMRLRLHDGYFIPREHMGLMLGYAYNSFDVDGAGVIHGRFDRDDVALIVNELYNGLPTAEDITTQLTDTSEEALEGLAVQTIVNFFEVVVKPQVMMAQAMKQRQQPMGVARGGAGVSMPADRSNILGLGGLKRGNGRGDGKD